ncbi:MAG: acetate kinase [Bacilli bacterium]|nr:acetate kinase [Bacilli bacterium]
MMKIMSINAGSSSLKFSLFDMETESVIASGLFERIGIDGSCYTIKYNGEKYKEEVKIKNHTKAVDILLEKLHDMHIVESLDEIGGVGHRIVNGKDLFDKSVIVDDEVMAKLESIIELAPLHNGANVAGIKAFQEVLPNTPMVVVFDTAFHQTMDAESYMYPVPYDWYTKHGIRKYGAHGTNHRFIAEQVENIYNRKDLKIISCHIGSGASIAAIKDGKCVDTSMGFTPLAGIMMGTRSGDIDPSILPFVMKKENMNIDEMLDALNKKSGLLGLSEASSDMRDIEAEIEKGNEKAKLAFDKFSRRIVDYIAQYYVLLGGTDVIVFTAGIGENGPLTREDVCNRLECLGVKIDTEANNKRGSLFKISTEKSKIDVYVISTDEELMIARDTYNLIK